METYATNANRAELARQENVYRMAELGLRKQQAEQTNQLNQLLTANQLQQRDLDNRFRDRQLAQQLEIAKLPSRYGSELEKEAYDKHLRDQQDIETLRIVTEAESALDNLNKQEAQLNKIKLSGAKTINKPILEANLSKVTMDKRKILDGLAAAGFQYNPTTGKFIGIKRPSAVPSLPTVSQLQSTAPAANLPQTLSQPNIPVPSFIGLPAPPTSVSDNLPRYETVQEALTAGHRPGDIVRVKHPITGVYARYQIE